MSGLLCIRLVVRSYGRLLLSYIFYFLWLQTYILRQGRHCIMSHQHSTDLDIGSSTLLWCSCSQDIRKFLACACPCRFLVYIASCNDFVLSVMQGRGDYLCAPMHSDPASYCIVLWLICAHNINKSLYLGWGWFLL